ncbi:bifunctional DNA primase/polymerase [Streptomyces himalayensis]|uniref:Bifunctional DNA primase/polymerase n=1 Tax=Streptomyces himalayensis subsp. himalayensis TaxID=2756131 RepID=A0A7W0DR87_9ACTN|nr:bifunctional DNA primase/polymerase [Streptomyces himalayensis]MBA2949777.1 bifunctional DNA primase/polymerase [Streptomyces himalayensis subsp. himalayensis]
MSSKQLPVALSVHALSAHDQFDVSDITFEGASWLASAGSDPQSTLALWHERPEAPIVLPCGDAFDVVNVPAIFGRRMLDRLWDEGPGSGPIAAYRGRMLLFAAPGTAQRLPSLLAWEEWAGRCRGVPPLLCYGRGDAVTVPPLVPGPSASTRLDCRWLVAPGTRNPWLPGPEVLLWAGVRAARETAERPGAAPARAAAGDGREPATAPRISIFLPPTRVLRSSTSAGAASSVG